mgnify:FL=1
MTKIYIDFDGVILDTWEVIFKKYYEEFNTTDIKEDNIKKIMLTIGWNYILENSKEINYSLEKIKRISKTHDICILTKINSKQEQDAKTNFLLENKIKKMCFVPYTSSKTQYVDPHNNILIDDDIKNLEEWEQHGGIAIFFNKDLNNYDSYGNKNNKFVIINDLLKIYGII